MQHELAFELKGSIFANPVAGRKLKDQDLLLTVLLQSLQQKRLVAQLLLGAVMLLQLVQQEHLLKQVFVLALALALQAHQQTAFNVLSAVEWLAYRVLLQLSVAPDCLLPIQCLEESYG